ncbi:methyltransferase domain-containing protein [Ferrimicrobium acidiphilum]|uniref:Methyltransferase domain-containing protein n=1 Tax=Ferrimicrobium acidiphilum TaxID=121039 RepID=A0ABV3Y4C6_9ACTN
MADTYIHGHDDSVLASHRWRSASNSAPYLLASLRASDRILDVGAGAGTITRDFVQLVPEGSVVAVDRTTAIVNEAAGHDSGVIGVVADAYQLPFASRSFDIVHAHQVLQHLRYPARAVSEMARVARRHVAFADADYDKMLWWPTSPMLTQWMAIYQQIASNNHVNPNIGRQLSELAIECGLPKHSVHTICWTYATPELLQWWASSWADRVLYSTYASEALRLKLANEAELSEIAHGWRTWANTPGAVFVITSIAILADLDAT